MKMNKFFAMALPLCAGALLAGCSDAATEEEIAPAPAATIHSFTATILNDDTRAYIGSKEEGHKVLWNEGDQMSFFTIGQTENPKVATLVEGYGGKEYGKFTYEGGQFTTGGGCYAVYPYNANDRIERHTIVTELPTEQTYKAGSHGGMKVFMTDYTVATDTEGSIDAMQLYNSGLGLYLKGRGTGFKIIIESKVEPLAGQVKIATPYMDKNGNYVEYPVAVATDQSSKVVTFTCDSELLDSNEAKPFCVAMLPGKYTKLRIKVTNLDGTETYFKRTASNLTFHQGVTKMMDPSILPVLDLPMPIDHNLNPLRKWAEADLVYNKQAKSSSIASNYTVQGSLYQWGRNVGWSNYKDALGNQVNNKFWNYATYDDFYYTGTGMYAGTDQASRIAYDNANAFTAFPDVYFMDPFGTDYWPEDFGDGGSNWNERAKKCGFNGSPCPSGYHMPTKAEFLEIKPSGPLSGSSSLASVVNNRVELRKIEGGCTYAMRWSAVTKSSKTYLRIDALVVEEDFAEADLSTIDWNDENVVTRHFGANGFIHGFYHLHTIQNGTKVDRFPVARPMPGVETHNAVLKRTSDGQYYTITWDYITDYSVNNEGYYWMSDDKTAFTFQDNTRVKYADQEFSNRLSVFGTYQVNAQDCCSIRCVED